jgi:hypothetical protein
VTHRTGKIPCIYPFFSEVRCSSYYAVGMATGFIPGPLLGQTVPLAQDVGVRLRLAHFSDWPKLAELFSRQGWEMAEAVPEARRLVQFDPRRRYVLCACALINSTERLVGVGAIEMDTGGAVEPDLIVVDSDLAPPASDQAREALTRLLWGALVGAAQAAARVRAA